MQPWLLSPLFLNFSKLFIMLEKNTAFELVNANDFFSDAIEVKTTFRFQGFDVDIDVGVVLSNSLF